MGYRATSFLALAIGALLWFSTGGGTIALAQHSLDPSSIADQYNREYQPVQRARESGLAVPNSTRDRTTANPDGRESATARRSIEDLDARDTRGATGAAARGSRVSALGVPHTRALRPTDAPPGRPVYTNKADEAFYSSQQERDRKYFEALREPNAKTRLQLLREFKSPRSQLIRGDEKSRDSGALNRDDSSEGSATPNSSDDLPAALPRERSSAPPVSSVLSRSAPSPRSRLGTIDSSAAGRRSVLPDSSDSGRSLGLDSGLGSTSSRPGLRPGRTPVDVLRRSRARDLDSDSKDSSDKSSTRPSPPR